MTEQVWWAAGARLPIVMCVANRAMAAPWNVLNDQQDSMSVRDAGWIQLYCRDNQEILDTTIQAYRIAEQLNVPVMVCYDGFLLSHTVMPVDGPDGRGGRRVPAARPAPLQIVDPADPRNIGPVTLRRPARRRTGRGAARLHGAPRRCTSRRCSTRSRSSRESTPSSPRRPAELGRADLGVPARRRRGRARRGRRSRHAAHGGRRRAARRGREGRSARHPDVSAVPREQPCATRWRDAGLRSLSTRR